MKILYYNCAAGISGDMNLAAMLDLGVDKNTLVGELEKLGLEGWKLETFKDERGGIFGTRVEVVCEGEHGHCHEHHHEHHREEHSHEHHHEHRHYSQIKEKILNSALSQKVKDLAIAIFERIASAEAQVHGRKIEDVCFHEVGAVDSIIDIVGAAICADMVGADKFACSKVELGGGTVRCAHGTMPVPAPATALLAQAFPSTLGAANCECTTPTGAAIIAELCSEFEPKIFGKILKCGVGVGHRKIENLANVLRVMLIETGGAEPEIFSEKMFELSANIDDMPPEQISLLCEKLFEAGALDVWQEGIFMKKGRLAAKVCALVNSENLRSAKDCFFMHSSTLGLRQAEVLRESLPREFDEVKTPLGKARRKIASFKNLKKSKFEFGDAKKIAEENSLSIMEVLKILNSQNP
ncbi:MAG: nickel pincer cofactor biosynthesis protein LarC [Opitutales bacterium]|nr:nickel pincer cofactor biosynthesis protein LarC [Opitutales bacterium]